jgi:RNA polymerase sigma-70 factor (ECF subfamily)
MSHAVVVQSPSEEELALRARQGCSASFEQLVRQLQVPLLHFLRRWSSREDAEDLAQDTFVRAYENLHRYRTAWRFRTWLFTIARRLSINRQRRQRPIVNSERLESASDGSPPPAQILSREESRRGLWELAETMLTEQQTAALWLYYVEDMPVKQIARVLGRTGGAVKAMLFRARKRMMPLLEKMHPELVQGNRTTEANPKTSSGQQAAECSHG